MTRRNVAQPNQSRVAVVMPSSVGTSRTRPLVVWPLPPVELCEAAMNSTMPAITITARAMPR